MSARDPDRASATDSPGPGEGRNEVPDAVESGPPGTRFSEVRRFSRLDSTNRYLLDVARDAPRPGLVAMADHQSAGRGRLGRAWEAPPGANLLVSVLLVPALPADELHLCSAAVALAAAQACEDAAVIAPADAAVGAGGALVVSLKWPNDLIVGERKLAGVLAETVPVDDSGPAAPATEPRGSSTRPGARAVVVGVGVNVRWPPRDVDGAWSSVPAELRGSATSIRRESAADVEPRDLLQLLLVYLEERLRELDDVQGRVALVERYRARCSTLGRRVRVELADGEVTGDAVDITAEGHLLVDTGAGLTAVTAGDVVHVRGAG